MKGSRTTAARGLPVDCAVYVVAFRSRVDGVNVTVVQGELQAAVPFT
ncbi:MAG: hypothetical protein ACRETU_09930 [Steroidobacterales bacterium]